MGFFPYLPHDTVESAMRYGIYVSPSPAARGGSKGGGARSQWEFSPPPVAPNEVQYKAY